MLSQGDAPRALKEAAKGLGVAHRSGLHLRENFFYRMLATTYLEMNEARRAHASQQRALHIAGTVGLKYLVGTSWTRLSDNERILGRFGNALDCGKRALSLMGADAPARDLGQAKAALFGAAVFCRVADDFLQVGEEAMNAELANDRAHAYLWHGRDLMFNGAYREAVHAFREARKEFDLAGYPYNSVWAMLLEARANLHRLDQSGFEKVMTLVRPMVGSDAPTITQFDFRIVELAGRYLFRAPADESVRVARETLAMVTVDGDASLRIELFYVLFRLFARSGEVIEATRMFDLYRSLISEVLANVDVSKAADVAECFNLNDILKEYSVVTARD
jgi:tetratricopeptide (TPR) repeat protein